MTRADGDSRTHYEVLGVLPDAPFAVIRAAFHALGKTAHPDRGGSEDEYKAILRAFNTLRDHRDRYDEELRDAAPAPARSATSPAPARSATSPAAARSATSPAAAEDDVLDADVAEERSGGARVRTDPVAGTRRTAPASGARNRWTASFQDFWAPWETWRLWTLAALAALAVVLWFVAGYAEARGVPTLLVSIAMLLPLIARVRATTTVSRSLGLELAVVAAAALYAQDGPEVVDYQRTNPLLFALAVVALGEVARGGMRNRYQLELVQRWTALQATAQAGGQVYWIRRSVVGTGRTTALLHDAESKRNQTRVLWGRWPAGTWVAVDPAGAVMASCSDDARRAWLATSGSRR